MLRQTITYFKDLIKATINTKAVRYLHSRINIKKSVVKPNMHTKNKWLYPNDNFGKLERGVVYYSEINKAN